MKPTKEQILAEPAGPRLDAWVAEFVLGKRIDHTNPNRPTIVLRVPMNSDPSEMGYAEQEIPMLSSPDAMTTGAAWRVVEALEWPMHLWREPEGYACYFKAFASSRPPQTIRAETAPLAICRAALLLATLNS